MKGDRVEIVIDAGSGTTRTYDVTATRAGRRVNVTHGRGVVEVSEITRGGSTVRTARFLDYFFAPGADEEWVRELLELDGQVGREDRALVEAVQRGVSTGLVEDGTLMAESEQLVARFQQLVRDAVG